MPPPSPSSDLIYHFMNIFTDNNLLNIFLRVANGHMSNSFFFSATCNEDQKTQERLWSPGVKEHIKTQADTSHSTVLKDGQ